MIVIPLHAEEVLGEPSPICGVPDEAAQIAHYLRASQRGVTDFRASIREAQGTLERLHSAGVHTVTEKLSGQIAVGALAVEHSLEPAARACARYVAEVEQIHHAARLARQRAEDALAAIHRQHEIIAQIASESGIWLDFGWRVGPPLALPVSAAESARLGVAGDGAVNALAARALRAPMWEAAALRWRAELASIDGTVSEWQRLCDERRGAEQALRAALAETALGQLIAVSPATRAGQRTTIARSVTGELWGAALPTVSLALAHPLLRKLLGTDTGAHMWQSPPDPDIVARNWAALSLAEQQRLIAAVPAVIGNLPGVPFAARDQANRLLLEYYAVHHDQLSPECVELLGELAQVLRAEPHSPPVTLVALELSGKVPLVAVGRGDLDSAHHLTWQVPGMGSDAHDALATWHTVSGNLLAEQQLLLLQQQAGKDGSAEPDTAAVIAFLAYDTPNLLTVLAAQAARAGSLRLAAELDGAAATRRQNVPLRRHTVVAHSYGTPVAANALTLTRNPVQSLTMVGSAGLDDEFVHDLRELLVDRDPAGQPQVYTAQAAGDLLAPIGAALADRAQPNASAVWLGGVHVPGASSFSAEGAGRLLPTDGHSVIGHGTRDLLGTRASAGHGYLDAHTQALRGVAATSLGFLDRVPGGITSPGCVPGPVQRGVGACS